QSSSTSEPEVVLTKGGRSSFLLLKGVAGEYLSDGRKIKVSAATHGVEATLHTNNSGVDIAFNDSDGVPEAEITIQAPPGEPLSEKKYRRAQRDMVADNGPGIDVSMDSRACNETSGSFEVTRLVIAAQRLKRLEATFRIRCDDGAPIQGRVSFVAASRR
ncbi:MAG: hypothetical protein AAF449_07115, partial [Myxococcota bacterium]